MTKSGSAEIDKLIEHRVSQFTANSEAAQYYTNTPAVVRLCFSNPSIARLTQGYKVVRVGGGMAFDLKPGDVLYVPPATEIEIDLGMARPDAPIKCDCIEIETARVDMIMARMNERLTASGSALSAHIDWQRYEVLRGEVAMSLGLGALMELFRSDDPLFRDLRIDARIEDMLLSLLQSRSRELIEMKEVNCVDSGVMSAVRKIRADLSCNVPNDELAQTACMSESSLLRHFRQQFGMTPTRFANQLRISAARRMLNERHMPVETIAYDLGFSSASHFARVFRQFTGDTPSEFRKRRIVDIQAIECGSHIRN